jgi:Tfp pilus assembly protein PilP
MAGGAVITGCSDSEMPPAQKIVPVAQKSRVITQVTSTVLEEKHQPVYSYDPEGKRDPFAPIISRDDQKAKAGERPPLERYNVYDFKLTGVLWGGFGYSAMLESPEGKGYFVHVGTIVGQNKGVVKKISQTTMVVEEKFKTISGEIDRKEIVIELRKKQEGMQ